MRTDEVIASEEARRRLPEMLRSFRRADAPARYVIGRHRRPEAVLLSLEAYERLRAGSGEPGDPLAALRERRDEILRIADRHGASDLRVFGSVARGEAGPDSDIDLLVRLDPGRTLRDLGALLSDLERHLGRRVDVLSEAGLRGAFRDRVLAEAVPL